MEEHKPAKAYGPVATVCITLLIYFGAQIAAALLIGLIPMTQGWTRQQGLDWIQNNSWGMFSFVALVEVLTLGILYWFLKRKRQSFRSLGFNKPKPIHVAYALSGFFAYIVLYGIGLVLVSNFLPSVNLDQKQELGFNASTTGLALIPIFISLVILPPLTEEIVVRGFLFGGLRRKLTFVSATLLTSIIFAAAHLGEGGSEGLLWVAAIDTCILSFVLCYLREKTESLWPSIGVHFLKNGLAFIVLFNIFQYLR